MYISMQPYLLMCPADCGIIHPYQYIGTQRICSILPRDGGDSADRWTAASASGTSLLGADVAVVAGVVESLLESSWLAGLPRYSIPHLALELGDFPRPSSDEECWCATLPESIPPNLALFHTSTHLIDVIMISVRKSL